ncbi:MAG: hypothetical protein C5S45_02935 [Candidatus Methanocomedens sp.]|nr:MAG: hypothetical protein C5S45_02935 [ANME-2 cluster archaeon]
MSDFFGHFQVDKAFLEIDAKFESMESFQPKNAYDVQIQGIFPQYMVVFITRTIEGSIKNIIHTKSKVLGKNRDEIQQIESILKEFQNPTKEKIYDIFYKTLNIELKCQDFDSRYFSALGQIVTDRHKIAHSPHLEPFFDDRQYLKSLEDIKKHYICIKKFIAKLCEVTDSC